MKYSIIFKYIGEDDADKREFNLNNLNRDLNFDNLKDLKDNKEYIENSKIVFNDVSYIIRDDFLEILDNEIISCFGVLSEREDDMRTSMKSRRSNNPMYAQSLAFSV
tara:strand:+ start:4896 stop:5216 length:321 start_codon:yes stop_codon:yes gene_type:complete